MAARCAISMRCHRLAFMHVKSPTSLCILVVGVDGCVVVRGTFGKGRQIRATERVRSGEAGRRPEVERDGQRSSRRGGAAVERSSSP